jgi:hypothetical protein
LAEAIHERVDFSLSLKEIPSEEFVKTFKQKYEMEFIRLETLDPIIEKSDVRSSKNYQSGKTSGIYTSNGGSLYNQVPSKQVSVASLQQISQHSNQIVND